MTAIRPTRDSIALRAYAFWEAEGRPQGRHEHHWFAAEAALAPATEVKAAEAAPAPKAPAAKKIAAAKKPVPAKTAAPKAPAETVVAAAALAAPRAARTAKGARNAH